MIIKRALIFAFQIIEYVSIYLHVYVISQAVQHYDGIKNMLKKPSSLQYFIEMFSICVNWRSLFNNYSHNIS